MTQRSQQLDAQLIELIPALRRFAFRFCGSSDTDVDDLVQETLTKALGNIDKFQEGTQLKSWLFTIMRNGFCTRYQVAKREHVGITETIAALSTCQPHQEWAVRGQELELVVAALPKNYRQAFDLVFVQGISYDEAAQSCGCPVGTVKSRVNRARERITAQLN